MIITVSVVSFILGVILSALVLSVLYTKKNAVVKEELIKNPFYVKLLDEFIVELKKQK